MKRNWREVMFIVGYHLIGVFLLGALAYDLIVGRPG